LAPFFPTRCVTLPTEPKILSSGTAYGRRALDGAFACTPAFAFVDTFGASFRIAVTPVADHEVFCISLRIPLRIPPACQVVFDLAPPAPSKFTEVLLTLFVSAANAPKTCNVGDRYACFRLVVPLLSSRCGSFTYSSAGQSLDRSGA
jgi:hypothetical protein